MRTLGASRNPNDMPRARTRPPGTHPDLVHIKSSLAKSPGEIRVWPRRPHRQYATGRQRRASGAQSLHAIQRVIALSGQALRTVRGRNARSITALGFRAAMHTPHER